MHKIFETTQLDNLRLKNRLFRSATWEGLATPEGYLTEDIYEIYEQLAAGGVGTIVTGLTDVSPYNWALTGNMRLCSDSLIPDYKRLTDIVHKYDCNILAQLNMDQYIRHEKKLIPISIDELNENDLLDIVDLFTAAAIRAEKCGFDGVQIHLAYDWLLSRFINPLYNHRTDAYGLNAENRTRLINQIVSSIRKHTKGLHISTKFSFFDDVNGDCALEECLNICRSLSHIGFDSIEVLRSHSPEERNAKNEACYLNLALAAKEVTNVPIILTGNNHDIQNMAQLLNVNGIEYFGMSRPLIREPHLPNMWEKGDLKKAKCVCCSGCYRTLGKRCIFNK